MDSDISRYKLIDGNYMLKTIRIVLIGGIVLLSACHKKSKQSSPVPPANVMKSAVTEVLGEKFKTLPNATNSLFLCMKKSETGNEIMYSTHVVIWDSVASKIIYQKRFRGEKIRWYDNDHIQVTEIPGIVREDERPRPFLVNVKTGKKQEIRSQKK